MADHDDNDERFKADVEAAMRRKDEDSNDLEELIGRR
jgi:hypothetical protein